MNRQQARCRPIARWACLEPLSPTAVPQHLLRFLAYDLPSPAEALPRPRMGIRRSPPLTAAWALFHRPGALHKSSWRRRSKRADLTAMKALNVHAHFDDFEFTAAGTFEMWRRKLGKDFRGRVIVCTDGQAGHHLRSREETGRIRLKEQLDSARIGGYEFEQLRYPDGRIPREACLSPTANLLAALWKAIRDFEPDYLFCPPLPSDPLAGVHLDHLAIAEAVRRVAYLINVPHAYTPEYPSREKQARSCKVPVIVNVYDGYFFGANAYDFAVDIEPAFPLIGEMSYCHQSQIMEWLPWVGRHNMAPPKDPEDWTAMLRARLARQNRGLGIRRKRAVEVFTVTAWGTVPSFGHLLEDFPRLATSASNLSRLRKRLALWRGE